MLAATFVSLFPKFSPTPTYPFVIPAATSATPCADQYDSVLAGVNEKVIYMNIYIYICVYIYIHIHTHTY